jgi:PAS domain S-box-containing protein
MLVYSIPIIREGKPVGVRGIVLDITERRRMEEELQKAHDQLELEVAERTAELKTANEKLSGEIEERERAAEALRLSKLRYQTLFESAPVGIWHAAPDGSGDIVNEGLLKIAGMTQETVRGEGWASGLHPEDKERVYREWSAFVQGKGPYESTYRFRHPDGAVRHVLGQAVPEIGLEGEILGFIGTLTDITEQKHLETKLQEAQKMEAVGTLAGGIAHDFNNLLQAILGYADLLRLRKGKDEPRSRELQEIISASKRGAELTQQLLTFSRRVESKLRPTDLNLGIENTRKIFARTLPKMIEIDLLLSDNLSFVNADPGQMEQILMNLAVNAKDAMPDGGKLTIKTGNVILDEEYCRTHPEAIPGEYVLLEVSDTGHGMAEETLKHIFDPFFTTKGLAEGTGLGLAMVYGIVKSHNGYITCTSDFGTGTTFKIYLPAVEQEEKPEMVVEKDLCRGGTETILLVDDEGFVRDVARQILTEFGYTVIVANDGESALQLYEQERGRVDLVILDLIMPGIGGRKCLEKLLKINPKAKIVVASGFSTIEPIKETVEAGAKGFIGKPYEMKGFLKVVREVLDKP